MRLKHYFWRRLLVTVVAILGFVLVGEVTMRDWPFAPRHELSEAAARSLQIDFTATAYCKGTTTASGVNVRSGIAAADPELLPVGSVVRVDAPGAARDGIYTIMDTGPAVKGRKLDLYIWSCHEALEFGKRPVKVTILRLGWSPKNSSPWIIQKLWRAGDAGS